MPNRSTKATQQRRPRRAPDQPDIVMIVRKRSTLRQSGGTIRTFTIKNIARIVALLEKDKSRVRIVAGPIIAGLLAALLATGAAAQQSRLHDSRGRSLGTSTTDSQGTVTNYDSRGRVISRESTSGNTTTVYDASGRNVGRITTSR
jgi:YD repeat-containing protein